ncbi:hypothetical protein PGB90_005316 [Kerria lacca]
MAVNEPFKKEMKILHWILSQGKVEDISKLRQTKEFLILLKSHGAEIIVFLSSFLNNKQIYNSFETVECYEELIKIIIEHMDVQNAFITFLEQIDEDNCCVEKFLFLLKPLKLTLVKLADLRGYWLEWSLTTIKCYLDSMPSPEDNFIDFNERKMLIIDCQIDNIIRVIKSVFYFYETFIENVISTREMESLLAFGLQLLSEPAVFVYVEKFEELEVICLKIVECIKLLPYNIHYFLDYLDERHMKHSSNPKSILNKVNTDIMDAGIEVLRIEDRITIFNLAVYYFFAITEEPFKIFPVVYNKLYLFHKLLYLSIVLLQHSHNAVVRKGLLLAQRLLLALDNNSIPCYYLELKLHPEFVKIISSIGIYSYIFENRKLAIRLLQIYIYKFDPAGTYALYLNITTVTSSPDIDSEIITLFRNQMYKSFIQNKFQYYQKGKLLIDLLKVFSHLGNNDDIDLLNYKNKIISYLHLFALIMRRDINNETAVQKYLEYFKNNYFSVINTAIEKSRKSIEKDLHTLLYTEKKDVEKYDIIVDGEILPTLKKEERVNALKNALNALSMIDHAIELLRGYISMSNLYSSLLNTQ